VPDVRVVRAHWDAEAKVWWAESDDVPGLVTEAADINVLIDNILALVPELIELNEGPDGEVPVQLVADFPLAKLKVRARAA
jgi:predicted RNase H-like HicB family nuclease